MGGRSPRHLNTLTNLFIVAVQYTHQHKLCIVAIIDCTHIGSATPIFEDLETYRKTLLARGLATAYFGHGKS